jgi:hypothetical protein
LVIYPHISRYKNKEAAESGSAASFKKQGVLLKVYPFDGFLYIIAKKFRRITAPDHIMKAFFRGED